MLFAAPRSLGHRAKETSSALGGIEQGQFLGNFTIEGKLLQFCEDKVTQTVVSAKASTRLVRQWRKEGSPPPRPLVDLNRR